MYTSFDSSCLSSAFESVSFFFTQAPTIATSACDQRSLRSFGLAAMRQGPGLDSKRNIIYMRAKLYRTCSTRLDFANRWLPPHHAIDIAEMKVADHFSIARVSPFCFRLLATNVHHALPTQKKQKQQTSQRRKQEKKEERKKKTQVRKKQEQKLKLKQKQKKEHLRVCSKFNLTLRSTVVTPTSASPCEQG